MRRTKTQIHDQSRSVVGVRSLESTEIEAVGGAAIMPAKSSDTGGGCTSPGGGIIPKILRPVALVS